MPAHSPFAAFSGLGRARQLSRRFAWVLIISTLFWNVRTACAVIDAESDAALNRLALLIHERPDSLERGQFVYYQTLYNLRLLFDHHVAPTAAVFLVRERTAGLFDPNPLAMKLETDLRLANSSGLLSQENLVRLQNGQAPVFPSSTDHPRPVRVVKIRPNALDYSLANLALDPSPPEKPALAGKSVNSQIIYSTPSPQQVAVDPSLAGKSIASIAPRMVPGQGMVYPTEPRPSTPPGSAPAPATQVQLHDLPFNEMLPLGGRIKLAIAHVTSQGIDVAILGEHEVFMPAPIGVKAGTYHPSVNKFTVPKINPVRLPGIDSNAYLIHRVAADETGQEARWFFLDVTLNNGMTFRIAKVTGPL